jgi:hypothetical protein
MLGPERERQNSVWGYTKLFSEGLRNLQKCTPEKKTCGAYGKKTRNAHRFSFCKYLWTRLI